MTIISALALAGCGLDGNGGNGGSDRSDRSDGNDGDVVEAAQTPIAASAVEPHVAQAARRHGAFDTAPAGSNGRSCATCHVLDAHGVLPPSYVAQRLATAPDDPLFSRLDADDPAAATPTFHHLTKGLIRVTLALPANMDVIDADGRVITAPDRTISVWRGVPTIENTAFTAPYQLDGRVATLPAQAQAAISSHAAGPIVTPAFLSQIARFERTTFSSPRAELVAVLAAAGVPLDEIPSPERVLALNPHERHGKAVFDKACAGCHGGATVNTVTNRTVHDALFPQLAHDGNIVYDIVDGQPTPRLVPRPHDEFLNVGFGLLSGYGQLGLLPMANADVELPRYRFRFYSDASRRTQVVDLPPIPRDASGAALPPNNPTIPTDDRGAPIVGPSFGLEWFSTDPGRAAITGDPADFEAFDVPQLRGIAQTAPYFHDNSHATLGDVVDSYSRFILPFPPLGLPPIYRDSPTSPFVESLTLDEKHDLVAYLQRL